jgi:hypothetical protein
MTAALLAFGTILQIGQRNSPLSYLSAAEIRSITPSGMDRDMITVTHMESPQAFAEFLAGYIDGIPVDLEMNYLPQDPSHKQMLAVLIQANPALVVNAYRVVFPDYGATTATATESAGVWTTGAAHGFATPQPIELTTTGALPAPLASATRYWARVLSTTTFALFNNSADAANNNSPITLTTAGSGTHTVRGGSVLTLNGQFKSAKSAGEASSQLKLNATLAVTGPVTLTP